MTNALTNISTKMECALFKISQSKYFKLLVSKLLLKNIFFSIEECFWNKLGQPEFRNFDIPRPCRDLHIVEICIKENNNNCTGFYHRQFPLFITHEVIGRNSRRKEEGIPECLKAFPSDTTDYDKFPTLKKLDDELNKLLKNH